MYSAKDWYLTYHLFFAFQKCLNPNADYRSLVCYNLDIKAFQSIKSILVNYFSFSIFTTGAAAVDVCKDYDY